ncbi:hypothetical protein U1Q18_027645, partial [Sarracenia purpurea var. burkii]
LLAKYVNTPEAMEDFHQEYAIPNDVTIRMSTQTKTWMIEELVASILPLLAIREASVKFPIP